MTKYLNQVSLGNWITIACLGSGFALQWGAFSSTLAEHEKSIRSHESQLKEMRDKVSGSYQTGDAHREQRETDAKLSEIGNRVTRIEEGVVNIRATLNRIENQTRP